MSNLLTFINTSSTDSQELSLPCAKSFFKRGNLFYGAKILSLPVLVFCCIIVYSIIDQLIELKSYLPSLLISNRVFILGDSGAVSWAGLTIACPEKGAEWHSSKTLTFSSSVIISRRSAVPSSSLAT